MSRTLILIGLVLVAFGVLWRVLPFGRLPGDIAIRHQHFAFYLPITTCILVSIVVSLVYWVLKR
ncbi:MAG TPA: DUF2905 domain-containing protein [Stellaceae bacterium]|nr:DUF2905 domain-containing protein [Stellaceae bacterium]